MPKVTKREMFGRVANMAGEQGDVEMFDFAMREIELLDRKSKAPKSMTSEQLANERIKKDMVMILEGPDGLETEGIRAGDMAKALDISPQKATALLTQLVKAGYAIREKVGKVTKFYAS